MRKAGEGNPSPASFVRSAKVQVISAANPTQAVRENATAKANPSFGRFSSVVAKIRSSLAVERHGIPPGQSMLRPKVSDQGDGCETASIAKVACGNGP